MSEQHSSSSASPEPKPRVPFNKSLSADTASKLKAALKRPSLNVVKDESTPDNPLARVKHADYLSIKNALQERLLNEIGEHLVAGLKHEDVPAMVKEFTARILESEHIPLNQAEQGRLAEELTEEAIGLGPLAPLLADPAVTDILVNGHQSIYVERSGRLERTEARFLDNDHVIRVIERIAAQMGRRVDTASPMVDLRLPDGTRINATLPPATIDGPTLSIRRFGVRRLRRQDLLSLGMLSQEMATFLEVVVRGKKNLLISGGTGAGKSTLLGALAEAIPFHERIVTIEDTAELQLDQEHVVRMETRQPNIEGKGRITARDLVVNSLRMRPDRIIVGEVRGPEALDMLQAMNTGHEGSMSTVHANSPRDALSRLETMVLFAGTELPSRAIREQMVSALHILVHIRRYEDGVRRIETIAEMTGMEGLTPLLQEIFQFRRQGFRGRRVVGEFVSTGIVPRVVEELREQNVDIPLSLFSGGRDPHGFS
jgi:pilus assembly protein CpaF